MKKFLSLLLAAMMLLGCVAFAEDVNYVGTWMLTGAMASGIQLGPSMLALVGLDSTTLVLAEDGSATITMMGESETMTWEVTENGLLIDDGTEAMLCTYADGVLSMANGEEQMLFTREGAAPAIDDAAGAGAAMTNVDPTAFEGQWLLTTCSLMGMELTAEDMGVYMAFVMSEGNGLMGTTGDDGNIETYDITYTVAEVEGTGTVLTAFVTDETTNTPVELMAFTMLEDGRIVSSVEESGLTMDFLFTKQVAE